MRATRLERAEALFHACLERPESERLTLLDAECRGDDELRALVLDLIARDSAAATSGPRPLHPRAVAMPGEIGPYHLLRKLGEGGFGEVYEAEQRSPIRRLVAIKILKAGMDSAAILARFEAERQALALMDHQGIARVYDAGVTNAGRSYFVMERVDGPSLTDYAEVNDLPLRARLELFREVCRAVEHAHQKGVIHRDLKPSNILVASVEGKPVPKVIDFGIAKATRAALLGESLHTSGDQFLGTPEYASPEQVATGGADVDTRSDVYSLGVVLYRLLTRRLPFERPDLGRRSVTELRRRFEQEEPARPSLGVPSGAPRRELRGDLDWILLRALEKDRARRYPSAAALADDIERHLTHQPVLAGPPATWYRVRKFVRRRRGVVAGACAVAVALCAGIVGTSLQAVRASRAEREASAVNRFLAQMLGSANPEVNPAAGETRLRDAVDLAARELDHASMESPAVEASVRQTLGTTYLGLGLYPEAARELARAEALRLGLFGPGSRERLESLLSRVEAESKRDQAARADSLLDLAAPWIDARGEDGIRYLALRGESLANAGRLDGADSLLVAVVAARRARARRSDEERRELARALVNLAEVRGGRGRYAAAESLGQEGLAVTRAAYPAEHHEVAMAAARLGTILENLGKLGEAEALRREALRIHTRVLGETHPVTAISRANLALVLAKEGSAGEAEAGYLEALRILIPRLGEAHREVLTIEENLAVALQERGAYAEALDLRLRVLSGQRRTFGPTHGSVANSLNNLGALYRLRGDHADAERVFREALALFERVLGPEHPNVAIAKHNLGKTLLDDGRPEEAEAWTRAALALAERVFPAGHVNTAVFRTTQGRALRMLGRFEAASLELEAAHAALRASLGEDHARTRAAAAELALARDRR